MSGEEEEMDRVKITRRLQAFSEWLKKIVSLVRGRLIRFFATQRKLKIAGAVLVILLIPIIIIAVVVARHVPDYATLKAIENPIASEVYTADSVLIGRYYVQDRTLIKYKDISRHAIRAVVATEDARFFKHHGIDARSFGRVVIKSILMQDEGAGGGSTITQQLAKNLFPRKDFAMFSMVVNKCREWVIAWRLEDVYTKEEILTLYLNTIPFSDNTYGIQSAAHRFFSTTADKLTESQAALLVGQLKATHYYNPRLFPKRALDRRNVVLAQMEKYGHLDSDSLKLLQQAPLSMQFGPIKRESGIAGYFRESLKLQLQKWFSEHPREDGSTYNLYTDGLKIYTTIDSKMQRYAEKAVVQHMQDLQKEFFKDWGKQRPWDKNESIVLDAVRRTPRYRSLRAAGLNEVAIIDEMNKPVSTRVFDWDGGKEVKISPIDSIRHHLQYLNAGFIALDPESGDVKAWVGGIDHQHFQYDHVRANSRQVGSIFKPIVFAQAIESGISPCELISAEQETYIDDKGNEWTPKNTQYDYPVQYSMRGALAYSVNTVAVKLIKRAGIGRTVRMAKAMGIESRVPHFPSIALGSAAVSLVEMAGAYTAFVNDGKARKPIMINAIIDRDGKEVKHFNSDRTVKKVMSQSTARMVRHLMKTVVEEGTASRLRWKYGIYNDVAGKTGTTQLNADGWFMAITPNLIMGSWAGGDDPRISFKHTALGQGSNTALPMVAYFLKEVNKDRSYKKISNARFPDLSYSLQSKLNCDLYELDDQLWTQIEESVHQRDSLISVDTLSNPPPETFLQNLYKRKQKIVLASQDLTTGDE